MIEFTDKTPVINLTPNYNYAGITALFQLNDSILVVDSNAKCIVRIDRSDNSVTTHSGKCKRAASAAFDGSFLEARYRYPYDLTSRVGNYTHLYILDDNSLRLINQITETVMTVFKGYWFLDRLGFIGNDIIICGEGGIQLVNSTTFENEGLIQFYFNASKTENDNGQTIIKPYSFNSFEKISSSHIIAYRNTFYDPVLLLENVVLIDMDQKELRVICGKGSELLPFCAGNSLIPDYVTIINGKLYVTKPLGYRTGNKVSSKTLSFISLDVRSKLKTSYNV